MTVPVRINSSIAVFRLAQKWKGIFEAKKVYYVGTFTGRVKEKVLAN
jgi:hypothetical protein